MVAGGPSPELEATVAGILDRKAAGMDPAPVAAVLPTDGGEIPLPLILVVGLIVLAVGATSVWIRVAQPHTSGSSVVGGFKSVSGLDVETEVVEAPLNPDGSADKDVAIQGSKIGEN